MQELQVELKQKDRQREELLMKLKVRFISHCLGNYCIRLRDQSLFKSKGEGEGGEIAFYAKKYADPNPIASMLFRYPIQLFKNFKESKQRPTCKILITIRYY